MNITLQSFLFFWITLGLITTTEADLLTEKLSEKLLPKTWRGIETDIETVLGRKLFKQI